MLCKLPPPDVAREVEREVEEAEVESPETPPELRALPFGLPYDVEMGDGDDVVGERDVVISECGPGSP